MAFPQKQIDEWFRDVELSREQMEAYQKVRRAGKAFAAVLNEEMPDGDEKVQAIQQIRSSVLVAELSIRNHWPASTLTLIQ